MIIENTGLKGLRTDLAHLDEVTEELGFVRWQWEYYRATYDLKLEEGGHEYFLRINARVESGKLENPSAALRLEDTYIGVATFPHGLDYSSPIPDSVMRISNQKIAQLKQALSE